MGGRRDRPPGRSVGKQRLPLTRHGPSGTPVPTVVFKQAYKSNFTMSDFHTPSVSQRPIGRGAARSASKIFMIAGGNHTATNLLDCQQAQSFRPEVPAGAPRRPVGQFYSTVNRHNLPGSRSQPRHWAARRSALARESPFFQGDGVRQTGQELIVGGTGNSAVGGG